MSARDEALGWGLETGSNWIESTSAWLRTTPVLRGLIDWVALERVHSRVARENGGEPLAVIRHKMLDLIRSLVTDACSS